MPAQTSKKHARRLKQLPNMNKDISEVKANLMLIKWMIGFNLAFTMAVVWKVFT